VTPTNRWMSFGGAQTRSEEEPRRQAVVAPPPHEICLALKAAGMSAPRHLQPKGRGRGAPHLPQPRTGMSIRAALRTFPPEIDIFPSAFCRFRLTAFWRRSHKRGAHPHEMALARIVAPHVEGASQSGPGANHRPRGAVSLAARKVSDGPW
jgi:hypothetical protein